MPIFVTKPDGTNACKIYYDSSIARIVMESLSADPINISGDMNVSGNIQVGGTTVIDSSRNLVGINNVKQSLYMGEVAGDFQIGVYNDISAGPGIRFFGPQHDKWPSQVYLYLSGPEGKGKFVITKYDTTNSVWKPVAEFRPPDVSSIALELEGGLNIKSVGLQVGGTTVIDSSRNIINVGKIGGSTPVAVLSAKVARIYGVWGSGILIPHINNSLAFAPKKWTVTVSPDPSSGTIDDAFDGHPSSNVRWNSFPVTIEIDFGATIHYWQVIGVAFIYQRYAQYVKIEVYDTSSDSYVTLLEVTDNTDHCVVWSGARSYVGKIRITLDNPNPDYGEVAVCQIFGYTAAFPNSQYVYKKGDTMYGNLNIDGGDLQIGGTTVIDSSRNLMGINRVKQGLAFDKGTETVNLSLYSYSTDTSWRNFIVSYDKAEDWSYYIIFKAGGTGTVGSNRMFSFEFKDIANNVWYIPFQIYPDKVVSHKVFNAVSGIQINGTTVISSGRVLQNVQIDRATTDLPPAKVLEDTSEHSVGGSSFKEVVSTYVDSDVNNYEEFRIIFEAYIDSGGASGIEWGIEVRDDADNVLYSATGTNTAYAEYNSGWVSITSTKKLHVFFRGDYSAATGTVFTAYIRNIRIYCR